MSNKKQSSIDWLLQELTYDNGFGQRCISFIETVDLTPYFEQAKAMHKEEIKDSHNHGFSEGVVFGASPIGCKFITSEEYYNETYGGNNERMV